LITTIIIEDEEQNKDRLVNLLNKHCPEIDIVGDAIGVKGAYDLIQQKNPDLILLDIQLIDGTGFDLLKLFSEINFQIIFITAFDEYALKAFRFNALDYLLKPVDPDELIVAVNRAINQIIPSLKLQLNNAAANFSSKEFDKIILKDLNNIFLVDLSEITHCKSDGNYTEFHLLKEKSIIISKPIKEYETYLKGSDFLRIHRSYLINLKHFKRFEKSEGGKVILTDDIEIPVASGRRDEIFEFFERFKG